jgi:hypothetical protein
VTLGFFNTPQRRKSSVVAYQTQENTLAPTMMNSINGLSEESAQLARMLLLRWMTPETTVDDMNSFIRDNLPPLEQ